MDDLVNPKERVYFALSLASSIPIYVLLVYLQVIMKELVIYIGIFMLILWMMQGLFIGYLRGSNIRVTENQFPDLYRMTRELSGRLGLKKVPDVYLLQSGGLLNAFATRFFGRNFVVIYSDILELAYEKGEAEVAFILCHELAHIQRNHLIWQWILYPAAFTPFLPQAYSRACEYTCDRIAAHYRPDGAVGGLLVLAAGKKLYRNVNALEFGNQVNTERGFWIWFSEIFSSHPHLPKRLNAIRSIPAVHPLEGYQLAGETA